MTGQPQIRKEKFGMLRKKIIALFLLVALIPLIATSVYIFQSNSSVLIDKQTVSYEKLVAGTATGINQFITERMAEMKILASTTDIKSTDSAAKTKFLRKFTESSKKFDGNTFISPNGIVTADTNEKSIGINLSERPFFKQGLKGQETYTEVILAKTTGKRSIIVATPVKGENDEILGVLTGLVNFEAFMDDYTKDLNIDNGVGYPVVVDSNGLIQLHHNKELIGKKVTESGVSPKLMEILKLGNKSAGSITYENNGQSYLVAYSPIQQTGYGLYLHLPVETITQEVTSSMKQVIFIVLLVVAIVSAIAYYVGRKITKPIVEVAAVAERVSNGDLTVERLQIRSKDEVGQLARSVNAMVDRLAAFISQVNFTAVEVAASAEELSANADQTSKATQQIALTIEQMADGTEKQLHDVEVSVNSIKEVAGGLQQVAVNAQYVTNSVIEASKTAGEGNQAIQSVITQMNSINQKVNEIAVIVSSLGARSAEIENIVKVISEMAVQTNLLSLNAAIEAARAGEHGRGFAIVAGEVRKLAEQSAQSAGRISQLISTIQNETQLAVESMEQGTNEVALGIEVVNEAGKSFELIQQSINQVVVQIQEVTEYSQQMQNDTGQAVELVSQISEVAKLSADGTQNVSAATQEQLASVEEVTSSAESLANMAEDLQNIVKEFKV